MIQAHVAPAYAEASRTAQEELSQVEIHVSELEAKLEEARGKRDALKQLIAATTLLSSGNFQHQGTVLRPSPTSLGGVLSSGEGNGDDLPPPRNSRRVFGKDTAVYRLGLIAKEARRPLSRDEFVTEYENLGWVDPEWTAVRPAIFAALKRTANYGWITELDGQPGVYQTTITTGNSENLTNLEPAAIGSALHQKR